MRGINQNQLITQAQMDSATIGIIGAGAIGSFVTLALAKMGFKNLVVYDFDKIEDHNIDNQMYPLGSVRKRKVIALRDMVKDFSGENILAMAKPSDGANLLRTMRRLNETGTKIIIMAVDSLDVRKKIAESLVGSNIWLIDPRMGAKVYELYVNKAWDYQALAGYLDSFIPDSEASPELCGQKSIIYTVLGIAAEVCNAVHKIVVSGVRNEFPPLIFDYSTNMRIQKPVVSETVSLDDLPDTQPVVVRDLTDTLNEAMGALGPAHAHHAGGR